MWRETVIMTAGLASSEYRQRLVNGLLDRADTAGRKEARWLRLLAGACVETAPALTPPLLERIDANLAGLVPPRSAVEARSLALAGERVIGLLPDDLSTLSENAARAVVKTVAYVGGPPALRKLAGYGADHRVPVVDALIEAAGHFEPEEYGRTVLADLPLEDRWITVDDWTAPMLRHLRHVTAVQVIANDPVALIRGLPPVRHLNILPSRSSSGDTVLDLGVLAGRADLVGLYVDYKVRPDSIPATLTSLTGLSLWRSVPGSGVSDLAWVTRFQQLTWLYLGDIGRPRSFRPLTELPKLTSLTLGAPMGRKSLDNVAFLRRLPALSHLGLINCADPRVLNHIAATHPGLTELHLIGLRVPVLDLATITGLPLTDLNLNGFNGVLDLRPLAGHPTLESVDLSDCPQLGDLSPLASMPKLRHLHLHGIPEVDLAPLAGRHRLTVWVNHDQTVRNAAGVRVRR
jgi:hypothetical protein